MGWGWSYDWAGIGSVVTIAVVVVILAVYCMLPAQQSESEMMQQLMEGGSSPLRQQAVSNAKSPVPEWKMELYRSVEDFRAR